VQVTLGLFIWFVISCSSSQEIAPMKLGETNVLLIINCTLRADRLQQYGYTVPSSPNYSTWSKKGVLFDSHTSQAPWTRPSLGSIITGQYPRTLGLDNPDDKNSFESKLGDEFETIAEVFQQYNYHTIGATGNPNAKQQFGLAQGFASYKEPEKTFRQGAKMSSTKDLTDFILQEQQGKEIVFVQLITVDTHQRVQFMDEDIDAIRSYHPKEWSSTKKGRLSYTYDASVHYLDRQLHSFIEAFLAERPNTLIIQTTDHGEGLLDPEHHGRGHGRYLYPSTILIPHFWLHPSLPSDVRVDSITRNIDIVPTLLEMLELPIPDGMAGESYATVFQNPKQPLLRSSFVETFYGTEHKVAVYDRDYFWISDEKKQQSTLFARSDKSALHPIENQEKNLQYRQQINDLWTSWPLNYKSSETKLDPDTKQQLEALGYIE
jgi:arylsulfatase A-like enzyme